MSTPEQIFFAEHTLTFQLKPDVIVLYQALLRKGVAIDAATYGRLVNAVISGEISGEAKYVDLSCFSLKDCLLDNPAGILCHDQEPVLTAGALADLKALLLKHSILVKDGTYLQRWGKKQNLFDRVRIGNFHQQIGEHVLLQFKGRSADEWWVYQKFEKGLKEPRKGLYRWAQKKFMTEYFKDLSGQEVLDFGCGVGYYSRFFADKGATVTGVDPASAFIDMAREHFSGPQTEFIVQSFEEEQDFKALSGRKFDMIFLGDVFLYYFEPYKPLAIKPAGLLRQLKNLLKPGGRICICDPHGCFHLNAWLGKEHPFLVSTEYRHRRFRVSPNLEEISRAVEDAGLSIRKIRECYADDQTSTGQVGAVGREFPLWWFFEVSA